MMSKSVPSHFRYEKWLTADCYRDVVAGMDASQMDESLYEAQWAEEIDYHPFSKNAVRLE